MSFARVALVTGASRSIGRAIALRLADDGLNIALNDLPSAMERLEGVRGDIEERGRKAFTVLADVSSEPDVKRMVDDTAMVANAGVLIYKKCVDTTVEDYHRLHSVNSLGLFLCYQHAALKMQELGNKSGRIIGASSGAGRVGHPMTGVYSQTKFGVRGLTHAFAAELASTGITVNCYCPGWVDTDVVRAVAEKSGDVDALYGTAKARTPVGRLGQPEDIANVVSFLASREADFITGSGIDVNGGIVMN
ncbi:NAD(P)-binding protein [Schizophyllum commune H4-8]|nr:NAD(P)-binding protein [Schizophyllum commune H4-8]KAI5888271.1 NAD(P)-binding protein [Schizophyllum commune H4-8]